LLTTALQPSFDGAYVFSACFHPVVNHVQDACESSPNVSGNKIVPTVCGYEFGFFSGGTLLLGFYFFAHSATVAFQLVCIFSRFSSRSTHSHFAIFARMSAFSFA
jgi:hypothetical protein